MDLYLSQLKAAVEKAHSNDDKNLHIILGNEACDLDSAVSALVFAYFLDRKEKLSGQSADNTYFIPVLNVPRKNYRHRTEVRYVLSDVFNDCVEDWLIFTDEVHLDAFLQRGALSITLVDHHKLSLGHFDRYAPAVCRVIDHHVDNEPPSTSYRTQCGGQEDGCDRYITDTVGSCSTLVAERIINFRPAGEVNESILDEKVAKLLLSAILIDTSALRDSAKTTHRDIDIVEKLESHLKAKGSSYDRREIFEQVKKAKTNVSGMTVIEVLAKDYKTIRRSPQAPHPCTITSIGMSTVLLSFEAFCGHSPSGQTPPVSIDSDLEQFRQQKDVDVLVLTCVNQDPNAPKERKKQVVMYGGDDSEKDRIVQALLTVEGLGLTRVCDDMERSHANIRIYRQGNPCISRKRLLPVLDEYLNGTLAKSDGKPATEAHSSTSNANDNVSTPSPDQKPEVGRGTDATSERDQETSRSRARRFLDSMDLARSFSITYDGDEDEDLSSAQQVEPSFSHLGRIDESQLQSTAGSCDLDEPAVPLEGSFSCSTTEEEARHYPTVCTPYATSSYESGGAGPVNGSNAQEESAATLSGVPDLLDSRENLIDVVPVVAKDTPDLLVEYHSSDLDTPSYTESSKLHEDGGEMDLLQGIPVVVDGHDLVESDPYSSHPHAEASFSSYHSLLANYGSGGSTALHQENMQRENSELRLFDFSSDQSPAPGVSRADTPPSAGFHDDGDEESVSYDRRQGGGATGEDAELGLKLPGAVTPPNTFVDNYLDEVVRQKSLSDRRASQQSNLEPEILYMKLKGTRLSNDPDGQCSSASPAPLFPEGSVPGTPPNSFVGTPTSSVLEMAGAMSRHWHGSRDPMEPENLRRRVTELTKELPREDVEYQESIG